MWEEVHFALNTELRREYLTATYGWVAKAGDMPLDPNSSEGPYPGKWTDITMEQAQAINARRFDAALARSHIQEKTEAARDALCAAAVERWNAKVALEKNTYNDCFESLRGELHSADYQYEMAGDAYAEAVSK